MKNIVCVLFLILFSAILLSCNKEIPTSHLQARLGKNTIKIMQEPTAVSVFLTVPKPGLPGIPLSPEIALNDQQKEMLQKFLLNDGNYQFAANKLTVFFPTVAFKFQQGRDKELVIYFSLKNAQAAFVEKEKTIILDYGAAKEAINPFIERLTKGEKQP